MTKKRVSRKYSAAEKTRGIQLLGETLKPNYALVVKKTGIPRKTLADWWENFQEKNAKQLQRLDQKELAVNQALLKSHDEFRKKAEALVQADRTELSIEILNDLMFNRERCYDNGADMSGAALTKEFAKHLSDMKAELPEEERGIDGLPREDYEQGLRMAAVQMADRDLQIVMFEYARRHKGTLVFEGYGGHEAELEEHGFKIRLKVVSG